MWYMICEKWVNESDERNGWNNSKKWFDLMNLNEYQQLERNDLIIPIDTNEIVFE